MDMRLLVTAHTKMYKTPDGHFWASMIYGYEFFTRYLNVFDTVVVVAETENVKEKEKNWLKVDGPNLSICEISRKDSKIKRALDYFFNNDFLKTIDLCDTAILRVPHRLSFMISRFLVKKGVPFAVEVVVDPKTYFTRQPGWESKLNLITWPNKLKKIVQQAIGVSYVTEHELQKLYPADTDKKHGGFESYYTSAAIQEKSYLGARSNDTFQNKTITILHVSAYLGNDGKGYAELFTAIAKLKENGESVKAVIVGGDELSIKTHKLYDSLKIDDVVCFKGRISSSDEMIEMYKNADLFVLPTYGEGLPRVIIEAMAAGLPVISTKVNGVVELLDDDSMVAVGDSDGLCRKIQEYINNPLLMSQKSQRNYLKAQEYSSNVVEKKRIAFYSKLRKHIEEDE